MELHEKIRMLRKARGLTQEQFAQQLFVSRTAVSKWETGRGVPNIDSLRQIAALCDVSLDELLCAEEALTVAEQEHAAVLSRLRDLADGIGNVAALLGWVLPLYKLERDTGFYSVPLYCLDSRLAVLYWLLPLLMAVCGLIQLVCRRREHEAFPRTVGFVAVLLNVAAVTVLILCGQPYPAVLFLTLLLLKGALRVSGPS